MTSRMTYTGRAALRAALGAALLLAAFTTLARASDLNRALFKELRDACTTPFLPKSQLSRVLPSFTEISGAEIDAAERTFAILHAISATFHSFHKEPPTPESIASEAALYLEGWHSFPNRFDHLYFEGPGGLLLALDYNRQEDKLSNTSCTIWPGTLKGAPPPEIMRGFLLSPLKHPFGMLYESSSRPKNYHRYDISEVSVRTFISSRVRASEGFPVYFISLGHLAQSL